MMQAGARASCFVNGRDLEQSKPEELKVEPGQAAGKRASQPYGTFGRLDQQSQAAYGSLQKALVVVAGLWVVWAVTSRLVSLLAPSDSATAPAPAPSLAAAARPTCRNYTYPRCNAAIAGYLASGTRNRCEAFERVKAEGDFVQFPFSHTRLDQCETAGCCGCPGQCSRCPPLLAECSSWRLDGVWEVALGDGSEAKYNCDAHGHCELELQVSSLPLTWRSYDGYVPNGYDVGFSPIWLTIDAAKALCAKTPDCVSVTYDISSMTSPDTYGMFLKSITDVSMVPGGTWRAFVADRHPALHGRAAVAGPLVPVAGGAGDDGAAFRLDLHRAAPQLFPEGSEELLSMVDGELRIQRRVPGLSPINGTGIIRPSRS